ncbi:MAG: hypothetical protein ACUVWY_03685 [Desulfosoma sp.]|uniref:hypothetical protein n=1 Tax=Desulfosoma sp. TaxID=2603217 RepID=UPI0040498F8C
MEKKPEGQRDALEQATARAPELTDEDVLQAMKTREGYLDIALADFRELYALAYREALPQGRDSAKVDRGARRT